MNKKIIALAFSCLSLVSLSADAAVPKVAVDIAPLHSLVSQVTAGIGQPSLLISPGSSPHEYTLRPSEAKALAEAEVVFMIGGKLTPWLEKALNNIAESATKIEMLDAAETVTHSFRKGATFTRKKHKEEKHDKKEKDGKEHHDHEGLDPHAWLDPVNAQQWLTLIANTLAKADPDNAKTYQQNAKQASNELDKQIKATEADIKALGKPKFIVFHDAYQYFEKRFGIEAAGSILLGDAQDPSPARIKEIQTTVKKLGVTCAFAEPQYNPGLVNNVFEGSTVSAIAVMDPLGSSFPPGPDLYKQLISSLVESIKKCP